MTRRSHRVVFLRSRASRLATSVICLLFLASSALGFEYKQLANKSWMQYRSDNFLLVTDLPVDQARYLLDDLESYRYFLVEVVELRPASKQDPLALVAISDTKSLASFGADESLKAVLELHQQGATALANMLDYLPGDEAHNVARHNLLHEYLHLQLSQTNGGGVSYPGWYVEGMAELWATFRKNGNKVLIGDPTPIADRIFELYKTAGANFIDSENLFQQPVPDRNDSSEEGQLKLSRYFTRAFLTLHYLNSSEPLRQATREYLNSLTVDANVPSQFQQHFKMTFAQFNKAVRDYIAQGKMVATTNTPDSFAFPQFVIADSKMDKDERYRFFATHFWNFEKVDATAAQRQAMLEEALKKNPEDPQLQAFIQQYQQ